MSAYQWLTISLTGNCFFFISYFCALKYLQQKRFSQLDSRVIAMRSVSAVQAVMACTVGCIIIADCMEDVIKKRHWLTNFYIWFGLPYFYYDTWAMYQVYWHKQEDSHHLPTSVIINRFISSQPLMMFHHLVFPMIYLPLIVWFRNGLGDFFVGCFYMIELAVPFISLRAILLQLKKEKTILYITNGLMTIIMFAVCRVLIFPFMYWCYGSYASISFLKVPFNIPLKCNIGCLGILLPQLYWLCGMIKIAIKTIKTYDKNSTTLNTAKVS